MKNITIKNAAFCLTLLLVAGAFLAGQQVQADNMYFFSEATGEEEEKKDAYVIDPDFAGVNPHIFGDLRDSPPEGEGDFRVENYATGTGNGNYYWRGYLFKPSRDVVVVGMWGGTGANCNAFAGAILRASLIGDPDAPNPAYQTHEMLANVTWPAPGVNNTPYYESFGTATITLYADEYYFIGQGQNTGNTGSGCHYNTSNLDYENLEIGSAIISEWYPRSQHQYYPSGFSIGDGSQLVNRTHGTTGGTATTDPVRILVGFRYETDVSAAELSEVETKAFQLDGTNNVVMEGLLTNSGGTQPDHELTLYFEYATSDDFTGSTLVPAEPFTVKGAQTNVPFSRTVSGLSSGTKYYYRAVAINEAGRTNGETKDFTVGSMTTGYLVNATISHGASNGSVTPAARAVPATATTTFLITPNQGFFIQSVTGTCGGTLSGNTYTTDEITAACNVDIRLVPVIIYRSIATGDWNVLSTWEQAIVEYPDENNTAHWAPATSYPGQVANADGIGDPLVEVRSDHVVNIDGYEIVFDRVEVTGTGRILIKENTHSNSKFTINNILKMDASTTIQVE